MDEMVQKLKAYRRKRRIEEFIRQAKFYISAPFIFIYQAFDNSISAVERYLMKDVPLASEKDVEKLLPTEEPLTSEVKISPTRTSSESLNSAGTEDEAGFDINWRRLLMKVLIWCVLFYASVCAQFGAIFIILTGFYLIWTNTRTDRKKANEKSAYSVFNPHCEPIEGTFDAKQIENQLRSGMFF